MSTIKGRVNRLRAIAKVDHMSEEDRLNARIDAIYQEEQRQEGYAILARLSPFRVQEESGFPCQASVSRQCGGFSNIRVWGDV